MTARTKTQPAKTTMTARTTPKRFTYISIPGDEERGVETTWFVYDRREMRSVEKCEDMQDARDRARELNDPICTGI